MAVKKALAAYGDHIRRPTGSRTIIPLGEPPRWAAIKSIINDIHEAKGLMVTGVEASEIGLFTRMNSIEREPDNDVLKLVMEALVQGFPLELVYVSMKPGAGLERRAVIPFQLDTSGYRWDVHAIDIDREAERTFVFARIESARPLHAAHTRPRKLKNLLRLADTYRGCVLQKRVEFTLSDQFTEFQREAMRKELGLEGASSQRKIPTRRFFELLRLYTNEKAGGGIVWPPLESIDDVPVSDDD